MISYLKVITFFAILGIHATFVLVAFSLLVHFAKDCPTYLLCGFPILVGFALFIQYLILGPFSDKFFV